MSATIKDVARLAGVSVATVSRVLNNSANVSVTAAEQVHAAIKELGYSPNSLGRNLRKCETNIILAIIPSTEHTFYSEVLKGISAAAAMHGYDVLISTSNSDMETELRLLGMLFNRTVDAALLLGTRLDRETLMELDERYNIALACERIEGADLLTITVDDEEAAYSAISALAARGHRRIAMISTDGEAQSSIDREKGYRRALADSGLEFDERYIYRNSYDYHNGGTALREFMSLPEPPTAVFAVSDLLAVGAIQAAMRMGLTVGKDISIMGFDNNSICEMYIPSVSTVMQPCYEIGYEATERLIVNINSPVNKFRSRIKTSYRLIFRESTGD